MIKLLSILILSILINSINANNSNIFGNDNLPLGIRLSLGKKSNSLRVTWWTETKMEFPIVLYSTEYFQPELDSSFAVQGEVFKYDKFKGYPTTALLTELLESTKYYYYVGDKSTGVWSECLNFTTGLIGNINDGKEFKAFSTAFFGDLGYGDSYATIDNIISKSNEIDQLDFIVHVGDIAYADIKMGTYLDANQTIYNLFLQDISKLSSQKPYLVCPGNHDVFYDSTFYQKTWQMPTDQPNDSWYSFNYNGVQFISFSSEHDWFENSKQWNWLESQLKQYRKSSPDGWLIVTSHRPFYCSAKWKWCSNDTKKPKDPLKKLYVKSLEKLLFKYNVHLFIGGHSHSVEYTKPVYKNQVFGDFTNPGAPVHVTVGTGGNVEKLKKWLDLPHWSFDFRTNENGYSLINFLNETHLNWQFISNSNNQILNEFYLKKNQF